MSRRLSYRLDPAALFADVVGAPDAWQRKALRSDSKRRLYLASRQSGKSSVAALKALHAAMFTPRSLELLVSPSLPQSQEIFRRALTAYRDLGKPEGVAAESALRLELGNGSRIVSLPDSEKTNVGYSANLLVIDEAARTPSQLVDAMLPTVAVTGGSVVALTTPAGSRGWFYELWTQPNVEEVWERFEVPADMVPRIPAEVIEEARMTRGPRHVAQEYFCSFEANESAFFKSRGLEALAHLDGHRGGAHVVPGTSGRIGESRMPDLTDLRSYKGDKAHEIILSVDLGERRDFTAFTESEVRLERRMNKRSEPYAVRVVNVRGITRLPLNTDYNVVAQRIHETFWDERLQLIDANTKRTILPTLLVDYGGPGPGVAGGSVVRIYQN